MTKTNTLTPKSNGTASLPAELREIYDLLAAYGRKVRLAAIANGEQQKQADHTEKIYGMTVPCIFFHYLSIRMIVQSGRILDATG